MNKKVSIVIIAKDEEGKIARCIKAARESAEEIGGAEIILSDSASSDKTVEIALEMGVKVLRLKPEWKLSASAGRYIGTHYASGDFILFVDADTLIYKEFLPKALAAFYENEKIAGVCGFLDDSVLGSEDLLVFEKRSEKTKDVKWLRGGCCLYRRKAVLEVGSFNPHLCEEEEADIGLRLKRAGWNLQMLPIPMAVHTRCMEELSRENIRHLLSRRIISGRIGGITRALGYAFKNGYGFEFCFLRIPTLIFFTIWITLILIMTVFLTTFWKIAALCLLVAGIVLIRLKKGDTRKTFWFFVLKTIGYFDLILGLAKLKFTPTENYPLDVEILENRKAENFLNLQNSKDFPLYQRNLEEQMLPN